MSTFTLEQFPASYETPRVPLSEEAARILATASFAGYEGADFDGLLDATRLPLTPVEVAKGRGEEELPPEVVRVTKNTSTFTSGLED